MATVSYSVKGFEVWPRKKMRLPAGRQVKKIGVAGNVIKLRVFKL